MVVLNPQVRFSSIAIAMPRGSEFRMVENYLAGNQFIEQAMMPILRSEELGPMLKGAAAFYTRDIVQRDPQVPLHALVKGSAYNGHGGGSPHADAGAGGNRKRYSVLPGGYGGHVERIDGANVS